MMSEQKETPGLAALLNVPADNETGDPGGQVPVVAAEIGRKEAEQAAAPPPVPVIMRPSTPTLQDNDTPTPKILLTDDREKSPVPDLDESGRIVQDDPEDPWVIQRKVRADAFNTIRKVVAVTPSVCPYDRCGKDICEINNLPTYDKLDPGMQRAVDHALMSHVARYHGGNKQVTVVRRSSLSKSFFSKALKF